MRTPPPRPAGPGTRTHRYVDDAEANARSRLSALALAPGTGEDIVALTDEGGPTRWQLEWKHVALILGAMLVGVLAVLIWALASHTASVSDHEPAPLQTSVEQASPGVENQVSPVTGGEVTAPAPAASTTDSSGESVVYVSGQVPQAGVYTLPAPARVGDAVQAAGGLGPQADPAAVNLAAAVEDGAHVHVPAVGETIPPDATAGGSQGGADTAGANSAGSAGSALININSASSVELEELPGVGPATAADIVTYRQEHGPFASVDDLENVPGIGPAKLAKMRDHATV
ncbi:helix-hairpin-helix domain-containing protein [Neoactinobaculum massilliense]|uniref:helix-hairpin-helix domain-containing protein n=1 Tax=Neoactinobaculum massilliense TaxID=2364794 RepID=UPI0019D11F6E|nr:helix-hairpin-helix domain-containing protein [Neoactinobaculum massilliense]